MDLLKNKLSTIILVIACLFFLAKGQNTITVDPATTYQTITGWEGTGTVGQKDYPLVFQNWRDEALDRCVNELGINRVRISVVNHIENTVDYWDQYVSSPDARWDQPCYQTYKSHWSEVINDNSDPSDINLNGFQFSELDFKIDNIAVPMKQLLEAKGEKLFINAEYHGNNAEHFDHPEEYAEFVLAIYLHMQSKYGFVPDAWEMILEPKSPNWSGQKIANCLMATAAKLEASGFTPRFIAPSCVKIQNSISWFDDMAEVMGDPNVTKYMEELSYHRYGDNSVSNLQAVASRAVQYGINTSQLEKYDGGGTYHALHEDLKIARNSAWQQYTLTYPGTEDNGGAYYKVNISDTVNPVVTMGSRSKFLRQYFMFIRNGAVRIEAASTDSTFDPLAFINTDGKYVVVVKAGGGGTFTIKGLLQGDYGIKYTTSSEYDKDLPDVSISAGDSITTGIPAAGVLTVYQKSGTNDIIGVENYLNSEQAIIKIYPNPFIERTIFRFPSAELVKSVAIFNSSGKKINEWQNPIPHHLIWPTQNMPTGTYMLRANLGNKYLTKKITLRK